MFPTQRWNSHLWSLLDWQAGSLSLVLLKKPILTYKHKENHVQTLPLPSNPAFPQSAPICPSNMYFETFYIAQSVKNPPAMQETPQLIPGLGRSSGEGIDYPLQCSWASLVAQLVKNHLQCRRPAFSPWVGKIPWRKESIPTAVLWPGEFHGLYSPWCHKESDTT